MSEENKKSEPFEIDIQFQPAPQGGGLRDPSPGFQVVAVGLVAYIFYTAKIVTFAWLHRISIALVIFGFVVLIIETLRKIRIH